MLRRSLIVLAIALLGVFVWIFVTFAEGPQRRCEDHRAVTGIELRSDGPDGPAFVDMTRSAITFGDRRGNRGSREISDDEFDRVARLACRTRDDDQPPNPPEGTVFVTLTHPGGTVEINLSGATFPGRRQGSKLLRQIDDLCIRHFDAGPFSPEGR